MKVFKNFDKHLYKFGKMLYNDSSHRTSSQIVVIKELNPVRVYILLTDTGSNLTKLIKMFTKQPYNHASLALDQKLEYTYSFGRLYPNNPLIGGFSHERLDAGVFKGAQCQVLSLEVDKNQYEKLQVRITKMKMNQGKYKYNFLGLFGAAAGVDIPRKHAYFCSQFVADALQEVGLLPEDFPAFLTKPDDIAKALNVRVEFEGTLDEYLTATGFNTNDRPITKPKLGLKKQILYLPLRVAPLPFKVAMAPVRTARYAIKHVPVSDRVRYLAAKPLLFQNDIKAN